jgi:hypothetical protein
VQAAAAINNPGSLDTRILNLGRSFLALPTEKRLLALAFIKQLMGRGASSMSNLTESEKKCLIQKVAGEVL